MSRTHPFDFARPLAPRGRHGLLALVGVLCLASTPTLAIELAIEEVEEGQVVVENVFAIPANQVDQWVFPNQTYDQVRKNAASALGVQIDYVAQAADLSAVQRTKLDLAGRGDLSRFFEDYESLKASIPSGRNVTQETWAAIWQRIQPLQLRYASGLHGPGSLFHRTLRSVLTSDQFQKFESLEAERQQKHFRASVRLAVVTIESRVPLTSVQRKRLIDIIVAKATPPRRDQQGYANTYGVLQSVANMAEDDLKPIFVEKEWRLVKAMLQQYRNVFQGQNVEDF